MERNDIKKNLLNKKNIVGLVIIVLLFIIPISITMKKEKIKKFEIKTIANMYVMLEITNQCASEKISVLEFSNQQSNLMAELDKIKVPDDEVLENLIFSYKASCSYLTLNVLEAAKDGESILIAIDDSLDTMDSSMDTLKDRIYLLGKENKIDVDFSKDIQEEVDKLLVKIR